MDIDIDFKTDFDPLTILNQAVRASMVQNGELKKHPCGIYLQNIPQDPLTKLSAIPYKESSSLGYFKIDCLHLNILDHFENKQQIRDLMYTDPDWSMMQDQTVISKLFHLSKWPIVIEIVKPQSIEEVADCLALIRPKKQHLLQKYNKQNKEQLRQELYKQEQGDKTSFKRGHAIAYALVIVLQLHLIKMGKL